MDMRTDMGTDEQLLDRARSGDERALHEVTEPFRRELQVHCYRILGSVQDAEDMVQETFVAAWRGLSEFAGRSSVRTWLYRIATNRCLNELRDRGRRPRTTEADPAHLPEPTRRSAPTWHGPYPDALLEGPAELGPEARIELRESISLAFVTTMQTLPPRQRAVLVLRDVLGYRAQEVAELLDTTPVAVASALKRARAALAERPAHQPPPAPGSPVEQRIVRAFVTAFEAGDVPGLVDLLSDDAWLTMPPLSLEYQGREAITRFLQVALTHGQLSLRLAPTRANGQPAFGCYRRDPQAEIWHPHGLFVLTLGGDRVVAMTRFLDNSLLPPFALPRALPA